mgnify:CR=1 FL=1
MKSVTTHEAKTHLSRLLGDVERGEEIIICRGDRPVARLVPAEPVSKSKRPKVGTITSSGSVSEDAFAPLSEEELKEWGI